MKYPLNNWHMAGRETICFFFGHKWKTSKSVHTKWWDLFDQEKEQEIPYGVRKSVGNYLFEDLAWWSNKCTRCRKKERRDACVWPHQPWYKCQYWAIRDAWQNSKFMFTFTLWPEIHEYTPEKKASLWKRIPVAIVLWFLGGFSQYWVHFSQMPFFPAGIALDAEYKLMEWIDEIQK
jgi:hypothetical protein